MSHTTQQDLDGIVTDTVDLLAETRALQAGFADVELFGGQARFDAALTRAQALVAKIALAKASYDPLAL